MPREIFSGPDIAALLAEARATLGGDAVVLSVRRVPAGRGAGFELIAADPKTATAEGPRAARLPSAALTSMMPARHVRLGGQPAIIALVGPTGAGKTTTIAKLANHPRVFGGTAVGLLCLDTYRIGAVEQLRIYAEISRLPLEVVYEAREIGHALRRLGDCETILVDTAGRGPRGHGDATAVQSQLAALRPSEVHLALPVGLQPRLARRAFAQHRRYRVSHLLATKVDEFPEDGTVFDLALEHGLPMRWMTDGQEVPGDLQPAAPALLAVAAGGRGEAIAARVGVA